MGIKRCIFLFQLLVFSACSPAGLSGSTEGSLPGVEKITDNLMIYCPAQHAVREEREDDDTDPLRILLSRSRYWSEDGHLDVVARLDGAAAGTVLAGRILDLSGRKLSDFTIEPPGERFVFYPAIPERLLGGGAGKLEVAWIGADGNILGYLEEGFRVERFSEDIKTSGSIPLYVANEAGVSESRVPFTAGVPFPRGALYDTSDLRLVSADGSEEIPVQVREIARWSKFGSVKWAALEGGGRGCALRVAAGIPAEGGGEGAAAVLCGCAYTAARAGSNSRLPDNRPRGGGDTPGFVVDAGAGQLHDSGRCARGNLPAGC